MVDWVKVCRYADELEMNGLRTGQSLFNSLLEFYPEVAEKIRGTEADPFYDDNKIRDCVAYVTKNYCM